jgi:cellulose/xylan binding protein with CBM9 domain
MSNRARALAAVLIAIAATPGARGQQRTTADLEKLPFAPRHAIAYRAAAPLAIDGRLDEPAWRAVPWSDPFVDIEGRRKAPFTTRVKMLWDDQAFYVGADLEESDVWSTLTERDSVIFQDNDFELFIDPDGDTHGYYELEINALGTVWDLLLVQPYRDGGPAIHGWDIAGLKSAVDVRGTINRPGDRDSGWSVEIAMPWKILQEAAPGRRAPRPGDQWRVNFSRVQWQLEAVKGTYAKRFDRKTGKPLPEDNWVWSPQGAIDMHMPERWGYVQFSDAAAGAGTDGFAEHPNELVKWALRRLYYRQRDYRAAHGRYAPDLASLDAGAVRVEGLDFKPAMQATDSQYEIRAAAFDGAVVRIRQDGRVWLTR